MLADLSPMLTSLISELIRGPQIEVIGASSGGDLATLVSESGASVVILPGDGISLSDAGRRLLDERSRLRVVALPEVARSGVVGSLAIHTVSLEDLSKESLLGALTGAAVDAAVDPS